MLSYCKELTEKQKRFLEQLEMNPKEFLSIDTGADHYKFYHIKTGKEVTIRR